MSRSSMRIFPPCPPVAVAVLATVLGACVEPGGPGEAHLDRVTPLVAVEDARIGDFDDPDVGFSRVFGLDVDADGLVYVLEASAPEIRVYDPDGSLLRRIGGAGEGPGEFRGVSRFGVVGDTLWTWDGRLNRITLFDRQGRVLSTGRTDGVAVPLPTTVGHVFPWHMRDDGRFTGHMSRVVFNPNAGAAGARPTDNIPVPFVLFDAAGRVTDTIGWAGRPPPRMWRPPSESDRDPGSIRVGERRVMVPRPPRPLPFWEPLPDGYLLIETPLAVSPDRGTLTVTRFGLAGDTVFRRLLAYRPTPYSDAELDTIAARAAAGGGMGSVILERVTGQTVAPPADAGALAERLRAAMDFPEFRLPVQYTLLARDQTLWLRLQDEREDPSSSTEWVLLGPNGEFRGRLELQPGVRVLWNRGNTVWAVEPGDLDVPWVVRYRIRPR